MKQRTAPHTFIERVLSTFPPPHYLKMHSVGIDISEQDVRFLELVENEDACTVGACDSIETPENTIARGEVVDIEKLTGVLSQIKETHDFSFVRASLPEQRGYIFQTTVPDARDRHEVHTILEFQLEEHVPISSDEAVFDYTVIAEHANVGHTDISVTVFPQQVIEKYLAAFSRAGLVPLSFEIEPQAIARAVVPRGDCGTFLVLNVAAERVGVFVVTNQAVAFTSSIELPGAKLSEDAENTTAFKEDIQQLAGEIERYQDYWNFQENTKEEETQNIEQVILCGAHAGTPQLAEMLNARIHVPVIRANVWENAFSFNEVIPPIRRDDSYGYATAIGLALRESKE